MVEPTGVVRLRSGSRGASPCELVRRDCRQEKSFDPFHIFFKPKLAGVLVSEIYVTVHIAFHVTIDLRKQLMPRLQPQYAPLLVGTVGGILRECSNDALSKRKLDGLQMCTCVIGLSVLLFESEPAALRCVPGAIAHGRRNEGRSGCAVRLYRGRLHPAHVTPDEVLLKRKHVSFNHRKTYFHDLGAFGQRAYMVHRLVPVLLMLDLDGL